MKKTTIFLLLAVISSAAMGAVTTESHIVSYSESDYTFSYDVKGNLVIGTADGDASYSSSDEPGLPQRSFSIAIPGSRVIECELYQEADPERCQDCAGSDSGADGR